MTLFPCWLGLLTWRVILCSHHILTHTFSLIAVTMIDNLCTQLSLSTHISTDGRHIEIHTYIGRSSDKLSALVYDRQVRDCLILAMILLIYMSAWWRIRRGRSSPQGWGWSRRAHGRKVSSNVYYSSLSFICAFLICWHQVISNMS